MRSSNITSIGFIEMYLNHKAQLKLHALEYSCQRDVFYSFNLDKVYGEPSATVYVDLQMRYLHVLYDGNCSKSTELLPPSLLAHRT